MAQKNFLHINASNTCFGVTKIKNDTAGDSFSNSWNNQQRNNHYTVVANLTFTSVKTSISPSNIAQNANPGTVLKTAHPEDSKTIQHTQID